MPQKERPIYIHLHCTGFVIRSDSLSLFLSPPPRSLSFSRPHEPIRTSRRVRLGVGIYGCRRPFYFVDWYTTAPFLPSGLPIKPRSPRIRIPWEEPSIRGVPFISPRQRKVFPQSRLIARRREKRRRGEIRRSCALSRRTQIRRALRYSIRSNNVILSTYVRIAGRFTTTIICGPIPRKTEARRGNQTLRCGFVAVLRDVEWTWCR